MSRIQEVRHIYEKYLNLISSNREEWIKYLKFSSKIYKYDFDDSLLIYAQRPNVTAVASYDLWKNRIGRYVKRGSKGIAVYQDQDSQNRLRYLFDLSDTGGPEDTRPKLWSLNENNTPLLKEILSNKWGLEDNDNLSDILGFISLERLMSSEINDKYLKGNISGNYLELAKDSINYILNYRCGLSTDGLDNLNSFNNIIDFDNEELLVSLANTVEDISEEILREIELEIHNINKNR